MDVLAQNNMKTSFHNFNMILWTEKRHVDIYKQIKFCLFY